MSNIVIHVAGAPNLILEGHGRICGDVENGVGARSSMYTGDRFTLPSWAKPGVIFALNGVVWRIVATGAHNNTPRRQHDMPIVEYVSCEPVSGERWNLPPAPCPKADLLESLHRLGDLRRFVADDLDKALVEAERSGRTR